MSEFKKGERVVLRGAPYGRDLHDLTVVGRHAHRGMQLVTVRGRDWDGVVCKLHVLPHLLEAAP